MKTQHKHQPNINSSTPLVTMSITCQCQMTVIEIFMSCSPTPIRSLKPSNLDNLPMGKYQIFVNVISTRNQHFDKILSSTYGSNINFFLILWHQKMLCLLEIKVSKRLKFQIVHRTIMSIKTKKFPASFGAGYVPISSHHINQ